MSERQKKKLIIWVSVSLFVVSLFLPAMYLENHHDDWSNSLALLLIGWLGIIFMYLPAFPWLANLLILIAWALFIRRQKAAAVLATFATVLALSFLFVDEVMINEGGTKSDIEALGAGYWTWVISIGSFCLASLYTLIRNKK